MTIDKINLTNFDYLGTQYSQERKEYLEELNSRYAIDTAQKSTKDINNTNTIQNDPPKEI